jgi:hypothetical protein
MPLYKYAIATPSEPAYGAEAQNIIQASERLQEISFASSSKILMASCSMPEAMAQALFFGFWIGEIRPTGRTRGTSINFRRSVRYGSVPRLLSKAQGGNCTFSTVRLTQEAEFHLSSNTLGGGRIGRGAITT